MSTFQTSKIIQKGPVVTSFSEIHLQLIYISSLLQVIVRFKKGKLIEFIFISLMFRGLEQFLVLCLTFNFVSRLPLIFIANIPGALAYFLPKMSLWFQLIEFQ
jgi:hypothetical protein